MFGNPDFTPDYLNDGLGDVGDTDLFDTVVHDIKKLDESTKEVAQEVCPKCGGWDVWIYSVYTGIYELWAKCTTHGCGHVWCVCTE